MLLSKSFGDDALHGRCWREGVAGTDVKRVEEAALRALCNAILIEKEDFVVSAA